jgi:hypothetical protein
MKPADKTALLMIAASGCVLLTVFAKPLGIPDPWSFLPMAAALVLLYLFFRADKKLKRERAGQPRPPAPLEIRRRNFWIIAAALLAGSISSLFFLPYTVDHFWSGLYYYVIPAQVITVLAFLFYLWKKLACSGVTPK